LLARSRSASGTVSPNPAWSGWNSIPSTTHQACVTSGRQRFDALIFWDLT
jgi:hypothetical protein